MRDVFPYVVAIDVARYTNTILVGSHAPLSTERSSTNLEHTAGIVSRARRRGLEPGLGQHRAIEPGGLVFTDDRAPVELVIDQMIFDAAREIGGP